MSRLMTARREELVKEARRQCEDVPEINAIKISNSYYPGIETEMGKWLPSLDTFRTFVA